jgi:hypothetical protein
MQTHDSSVVSSLPADLSLADISASNLGKITLFPFRADPRREIVVSRDVNGVTSDGRAVVLIRNRPRMPGVIEVVDSHGRSLRQYEPGCYLANSPAVGNGVLAYCCHERVGQESRARCFVRRDNTPPVELAVSRVSPFRPAITISDAGREVAITKDDNVVLYREPLLTASVVGKGHSPVLSPDGELLFYEGPADELVLVKTSTLKSTYLLPRRPVFGPAWFSPDSKYVLFAEKIPLTFPCSTSRLVILRLSDLATEPVLYPCLNATSEFYRLVSGF